MIPGTHCVRWDHPSSQLIRRENKRKKRSNSDNNLMKFFRVSLVWIPYLTGMRRQRTQQSDTMDFSVEVEEKEEEASMKNHVGSCGDGKRKIYANFFRRCFEWNLITFSNFLGWVEIVVWQQISANWWKVRGRYVGSFKSCLLWKQTWCREITPWVGVKRKTEK